MINLIRDGSDDTIVILIVKPKIILKFMHIVQNINDLYKKSPTKFVIISVLVLIGLIFKWRIALPLVIVVFLWKKIKKEEESKNGTKKKCHYCKTEIDWEASICPNCHGKIIVWSSGKKMLILALIFLFLVGIFDMNSTSPGTSTTENLTPAVSTPSPEQLKKDREVASLVFAEDIIKKVLKSPSTAKFVDVKAYELSNLKDVWAVNGYVDSQNSFGAMIRSQWEVQLDYRDGKGGTVKSILFDGNKIL